MSSGTPRSLIVALDDDAANLLLIQRIFARESSTEVVTETDGRRGLELIYERIPDLVFLDLNLAGLGGDAVLRELRTTPETADIPVVMISGDTSPATKQRMADAGAQHYLEKPFVVSEILAIAAAIRASPPPSTP